MELSFPLAYKVCISDHVDTYDTLTLMTAVVELSPVVQKILSFKLLVYVFPHIFTIYLIHGFIFWSLGACVCVFLSVHGFSYWLNLTIVALCCYVVLFLSLPILTPVVETLGKNVTNIIWQFAHERPAPRRPTMFPFTDDLLFNRLPNRREKRKSATSSLDVEKVGERSQRTSLQ